MEHDIIIDIVVEFSEENWYSPIKHPQKYRCYEVRTKDAAPNWVLQHREKLEQWGGHLDLLHEDGEAHQVIVGHGVVNNILPLSHHTNGTYPHVSTPSKNILQ